MAIQRQLRRGTKAENDSFTGAIGELVQDTDNDRIVVHDGSKQGGYPVPNYLDTQSQYFTRGDAIQDSAGDYVLTLPYAPVAYVEGQRYTITPDTNNTGACDIDVNGLGLKNLQKHDGEGGFEELEADDLVTNIPVDIIYDGTRFIVQFGGNAKGAYVLITEIDISNDASIDFTSATISGFNSYIFEFTAIKPATDGAQFLFRCSVDGGSTFSSASAYITFGRQTANNGTGSDIGGAASTAGNLSPSGLGTSTNEDGLNGTLILQSPISTGYNMIDINTNYCTATPTFQHFNGAVFLNTTPFTGNDVDGIQFLMSGGNISSGKIKVIGI